MKPFSVAVAVDQSFGIGKDGGLPWHFSSDLKHFKKVTTSQPGVNAVIMGRKTWDSLPPKYQPLPGRLNVVITRQKNLKLPPEVLAAESLDHALNLLDEPSCRADEIFVIGGGQIFEEGVRHPRCQKLYITHIEKDFSCDTFFPDISRQYIETGRQVPVLENGIKLFFCEYQRKPS